MQTTSSEKSTAPSPRSNGKPSLPSSSELNVRELRTYSWAKILKATYKPGPDCKIAFEDVLPRHWTVRMPNRSLLIHECNVEMVTVA